MSLHLLLLAFIGFQVLAFIVYEVYSRRKDKRAAFNTAADMLSREALEILKAKLRFDKSVLREFDSLFVEDTVKADVTVDKP